MRKNGKTNTRECEKKMMTDLREFLATEVMGWKRWGDYWGNPDVVGSGEYTVYTWRPDELIEQAIMCAEKHGSYAFYKADEIYCDDEYEYTAEVTPSEWGMVARGKTLAEAVSLAVARAAGWKDDS